MTITPQQVLSMLKLQDEMNSIVNPDWRNAGYSWTRAIMVEAVECVEHHGWKWWKKQTPDLPQVRMELVDIWHFMLSLSMVNSEPGNLSQIESIARQISEEVSNAKAYPSSMMFNSKLHPADQPLLDDLQLIVGMAATGAVSNRVFAQAITKAGMTWDDLYTSYIGKNCLNRFRQAHGYKTGEYLKNWSIVPLDQPIEESRALEDNDHLHDILISMDSSATNLFDLLTTELEHRYALVMGERVDMPVKSRLSPR